MEVASTVLGGDLLRVATAVTRWVQGVDAGGRVEGLVHVADVMDDQAEGEGALVTLIGEPVSNLACVGGLGGADLTLEELGVGIESLSDVLIGLSEAEIIKRGAWLIEVGLVDVMPVSLEGVALSLDVISKGSALSEGVVALLDEARVILLEDSKLGKSSIKDGGILLLEESLSSSGNCEMKSQLVSCIRREAQGTYQGDGQCPRRPQPGRRGQRMR